MNYPALKKQINKHLPDINVHLHHSLASYTTLKIGGPADLFIHTTNPNQFISLLKLLYKRRTRPITILGHGSNVLISDSGIRGIVIKNSGNHITILNPATAGAKVQLSSSTSLPDAIKHLNPQNLVGLETFAYIPATIGGAIHSNIHGVNQKNFSDFIHSVTVFNLKTGQSNILKNADLHWGYDSSPFQHKPHLIITGATLKLNQGGGKKAQKIATTIIKEKSKTQPLNSAGCTFKNPKNDSAGLPAKASTSAGLPAIAGAKRLSAGLPAIAGAKRLSAGQLIDSLGLKGHTIGDAQISPLHANFIVNTGQATAKDYLKLAQFIRRKVKTSTGINLEFEIKLLGKF